MATENIEQNDLTDNEAVTLEIPEKHYPNSRANRIALLKVGESYSESVRLSNNFTKDDYATIKTNLRSTINKAAYNAEKRSGYKFETEAGEFFTRRQDLIITVVSTRVE